MSLLSYFIIYISYISRTVSYPKVIQSVMRIIILYIYYYLIQ